MTRITVEIIPCPAPTALEPEWRTLESVAQAHFFQSWFWVGPRLETAGQTLQLIRARRAGVVVGLGFAAIAMKRRWKIVPQCTAYLNETGDPQRDVVTVEYNDFLLHPDDGAAIRLACLEALQRQPWDRLFVRSCLPDVAQALRGLNLLEGFAIESPAAAIDLNQARRSGGVLNLTSANTRQQVRRAMRLYEEGHGALRVERAETTDQALQWFADLAPFHQARWQAKGKPGAFAGPHYRQMHERLIQQASPAGAVEIARISAGDMILGYLYNFIYRDRVYFYLSGLNYSTDARLKPGLVAHCLCAQRHADEGRAVYDFMAGENRYKTSLGKPTQPLVSLALDRPTALVRMERFARWLLRR
jgi:CelD/BcsL family acetyltransferase involved in cellulose biosynthesis